MIRKCFEVLFARDCHAVDNIRYSIIDAKGVRIEEPTKLEIRFPKEMRDRANEKLWQ